jgi:hypothetical protein
VGRVTFRVILGLAIAMIDVLLMLPLSFPDERAALLGAFSSRFPLGFFTAVVKRPATRLGASSPAGNSSICPSTAAGRARRDPADSRSRDKRRARS